MATEDLTTYTEVDPNSKLTVTSTKITAANLDRDEDAYVYKDYGANRFDKLDIDFELRIESTSVNTGAASVGLTASTVDDSNNWATNDFRITLSRQNPNYTIFLVEGDASESDSLNVSADTLYYLTISRSTGGTALNVDVFSDSARTTQVGSTLTITIASGTKFRYLYGLASLNTGNPNLDFDGFSQNIDINDLIVSPTPGVITGVGNNVTLFFQTIVKLTSIARDSRLVGSARNLARKAFRRDLFLSDNRRKR